MNNKTTKAIVFIVHAAVIAALYVVLTMSVAVFNLASGAIQVRVSEALTVLPYFTPAAIPGLAIGCVLANIMVPGTPLPDVIFGSLATLLGAIGTYLLRKNRYKCTVPPVVANAVIIPLVLRYAYGYTMEFDIWKIHVTSLPAFVLTVGAGEIITCVILGQILISALLPVKRIFSLDIVDSVKKGEKIVVKKDKKEGKQTK